MRFLISVIDDTTGSATAEEMAAIDVFNDRLQKEGYWVAAGGLEPPNRSWVIDNRDAKALRTKGPFVESSEYISGFWIIEAPNRDVALELAAEGSKHCNRKVEVRQFLGG